MTQQKNSKSTKNQKSQTKEKTTKKKKTTKSKGKTTKKNPKDPTKHPLVLQYQEMVRDSINDIYNYYSNHLPKQKEKQIKKLEENIRVAPYWIQNMLPLEYRKYRLSKKDPYDASKMILNKKV